MYLRNSFLLGPKNSHNSQASKTKPKPREMEAICSGSQDKECPGRLSPSVQFSKVTFQSSSTIISPVLRLINRGNEGHVLESPETP